jgi:diaminopimelate epimerase
MFHVPFAKIEGGGNDYLFVDDWENSLIDPGKLSQEMSNRHFGIGSDGLILVQKSEKPGFTSKMRIFNADGSEAEMCGNGIRGFMKYLWDRGKNKKWAIEYS